MVSSLVSIKFAPRQEANGTWTVLNNVTGLPAEMWRKKLMRLSRADAAELTALLNTDSTGRQNESMR